MVEDRVLIIVIFHLNYIEEIFINIDGGTYHRNGRITWIGDTNCKWYRLEYSSECGVEDKCGFQWREGIIKNWSKGLVKLYSITGYTQRTYLSKGVIEYWSKDKNSL